MTIVAKAKIKQVLYRLLTHGYIQSTTDAHVMYRRRSAGICFSAASSTLPQSLKEILIVLGKEKFKKSKIFFLLLMVAGEHAAQLIVSGIRRP
jgi:cobalamin biosynthesis Co2+ chelatase CbiK